MTRNDGSKPFTAMEKEAILAQIEDYMLFNMTIYEMYEALQKRFKRTISYNSIQNYRQEVKKRQQTSDQWLDTYARTEIADFYRQRIEELEYIQKNLFQILDAEKAKGYDKMNAYKYNQIARTVIENSKTLAEFGLAPPIIAKIKNLLPIDINELNKRVDERKELFDKVVRDEEEDNIKNDDNVIEIEETTELSQNEQSELDNIRREAQKSETAFFLKRDNDTDRTISTDNKGREPTDSDEFVF